MGQHPSNLLAHTKSLLSSSFSTEDEDDAISLLGNEDDHSDATVITRVRRNQQRARRFLRGVWRRRKSRKRRRRDVDAEALQVLRADLMSQLESLIDSDREEEEEFSRLLFQLMAVGRGSFTLKEISLFVLYAQRRLSEAEQRMEKEKEEDGDNLAESTLEECNQLFYVMSRMEKGSDRDNCYFPSNDVFVDYIFGARLSLGVKVHLARSYLLIRMAILQLRAVVRRGSRKREVDEYKEHVKDCLESYSLNALDLPSFHPLRSLPLFLLLEGAREPAIEAFLVKRAKELKFTRVSLRGVSQLEGRDAVIRDALEDAWFAYKYPFIRKVGPARTDQNMNERLITRSI